MKRWNGALVFMFDTPFHHPFNFTVAIQKPFLDTCFVLRLSNNRPTQMFGSCGKMPHKRYQCTVLGRPFQGFSPFLNSFRWSNTLKGVETFLKWALSSGAKSLFQNMTAPELLALLERLFVRVSEQLSTTSRRWN